MPSFNIPAFSKIVDGRGGDHDAPMQPFHPPGSVQAAGAGGAARCCDAHAGPSLSPREGLHSAT